MPVLNVRLTLAELVALKERSYALDTTMSELVRRSVFGGPLPDRRRRPEVRPEGTLIPAPEDRPAQCTRPYRRRHRRTRPAGTGGASPGRLPRT
jgi:hypothetical protein